ncbi:unnamed protein product [Owenia fusiformis]|uniref:Uncharacterized protein n=1 Tax=Owenia fusiformis TaxID=6347 RepID=A0A8J1TI31_OWEFU|nr:unnamed protein product [Owenia fusiformis]
MMRKDTTIYCWSTHVQLLMILLFLVTVDCSKPNVVKRKCSLFNEFKAIMVDGSTQCTPCSSSCKKGECVLTYCNGNTDTICRRVELNEFIEGAVCYPCTYCGSRREVLRHCSTHSDTKCGGCITGFKWDRMLEECLLDPQLKSVQHDLQSDQTFRSILNNAAVTFRSSSQSNITIGPMSSSAKHKGFITCLTIALTLVLGCVVGVILLVIMIKRNERSNIVIKGKQERNAYMKIPI